MIAQDEIEKAAEEYTKNFSSEAWVQTIRFNSFEDGANFAISKQQAECEELRRRLGNAKKALEFYATFQPTQFPDGYYETCYRPGIGGHDRFGTKARETLEQLNKPTEGGGK